MSSFKSNDLQLAICVMFRMFMIVPGWTEERCEVNEGMVKFKQAGLPLITSTILTKAWTFSTVMNFGLISS